MSLDTKFQVFISSTYRELSDWRKALIEHILQSDHIPSGMESFSAGDEEDLKVIERAILQCDIYTVVSGTSFGSVVEDGNNISFTQQEFRLAMKADKPVLAFLQDQSEFDEDRKQYYGHREAAFEKELRDFREEVKQKHNGRNRIVQYFRKSDGPGKLASNFGNAFNNLIDSPTFNAAGWLRLGAGVGANPFIRRIVEKLSSFDKLSIRCTKDHPSVKAAMARHFWELFEADIINKNIRHIYIESGSTLAYVADELGRRLLESPAWQKIINDLRLSTNNVLTFLDMVLSKPVQIDLVPHGPPDSDDRYGATFGQFMTRPEVRHPLVSTPLSRDDPDSWVMVKRFSDGFANSSHPWLILATASGLEDSLDPKFPGPHVGTYRNKLVKRALLESGRPTILFFDNSKIAPDGPKGPFVTEQCHPVCDEDLPWRRVVEKNPLGLCIGADEESLLLDSCKRLMKDGNWSFAMRPKKYEGHGWAVVLTNKVFDEQLCNQGCTYKTSNELFPQI